MKYSLYKIFASTVALMAFTAAGATDLECTPGNLHTLIDNPDAVTTLRLTGTVNAADLFFIDTDLKNLTTLDMSGLTIAAYNGTAINQKKNYAAATIPAGVFAGSSISTLVLPETPVTLGDMCFSGTKLKNLTVGSYVTLGTGVFASCPELETVTINATSTGAYTFRDCTALKSVTMAAATEAGAYSFAGCTALESVEAPVLNTVREAAFSSCTTMTEFPFSSVRSIDDYAFANTGFTTLTLGDCTSLSSIGAWAFAHCTSLVAVELPENLSTLGEGVFFEDTALATISTPGGVNAIPAYAFKGALLNESPQLLQEGITSIGNHALSGTGATRINMPSTLAHLDDNAMENMTNLGTINAIALQSVPELGENVWHGINQGDVDLEVAPEMTEQFQEAAQWQEFNIRNMSTLITPEEVSDVNIRARFSGNLLELAVTGTSFTQVQIYNPAGMLQLTVETESENLSIDTAACTSNLMLVRCYLSDGQVTILKLAR